MKVIYPIVITLIFPIFIYSQPEWIYKIPSGSINDYFVGKGTSRISKTEAARLAFENAVVLIMQNNTITAEYSFSNKIYSTQTNIDEEIKYKIVRNAVEELKISGSSTTIKGLKEVETYYEKNYGSYVSWVLVSLPKKEPISPPSPFSPIWRSFLFPGWGQLYKHETIKGISFLSISVVGLAGGLIFKQLSIVASDKAFSAHTQNVRDFYNNDSKNYNTYSKISFIVSGAFYLWSLIDAIVVKQDNIYVNLDKEKNNTYLCVSLRF
jgi:hypothetical protein